MRVQPGGGARRVLRLLQEDAQRLSQSRRSGAVVRESPQRRRTNSAARLWSLAASAVTLSSS